jgi:cell filamentation protein
MLKSFQDPYIYPHSDVLINKYNICDGFLLDLAEGYAFHKRLTEGIPAGKLDYDHLKAMHKYIFQDIYDWAGCERTIHLSKGETRFIAPNKIAPFLQQQLLKLQDEEYFSGLSPIDFCKKATENFSAINSAHPFREGNGRIQRLFLDVLATRAGYQLDWEKVDRDFYLQASIKSFAGDQALLIEMFSLILQHK